MIQVKNLKKSFGNNEVLKDINVTVKPQEVVVVIGPSGSGKSTFLRCINMLETITGGHVLIEGIDLRIKKQILIKYVQKWEWFFSNLIFFRIKQSLKILCLHQ